MRFYLPKCLISLLTLLLYFLSTVPLIHGQGLGTDKDKAYFSNTLIVKYQSPEQVDAIKSKTGTDPNEAINRILSNLSVTGSKPLVSRSLLSPTTAHQRKALDGIRRIYEIRYASDADPALIAAKLSRLPGIEYAEPKYIRRLLYDPDDPTGNPYSTFHRFEEAWNISRGTREVVIAIVDGGVGYTHPELDNKLWINEDEIPAGVRPQVDQDSDGTITGSEVLAYLQNNNEDNDGSGTISLQDALHPASSLTTGGDTDGNGFDDDLFGWDFWQSGDPSAGSVIQDNDPIHDGTDHGTHVAGIAAAETDNGQGIAGTGFNVRYMAIKAGGTPQAERAIGFGFEGIVYAAEQGADVINCSWGGSGFSQAEQDIVTYATDLGALVVGASGNTGTDGALFPGAYKYALSVGSIETNETIASYSNYGYNLDVLATGSSIQSTIFNDQIGPNTGTSMSSPVAAGLAGLVKSLNPGWDPRRIATQIRASAQPLLTTDPELANKLGKGKLDAFEALNTNLPGIEVDDYRFINEEGKKLGIGEEGSIVITLVNYGNTAAGLEARITGIQGNGLNLGSQNRSLGTVAIGDTLTVEFGLTISEDFDLSAIPAFRIDFTAGNYSDFAVIEYNDIFFDTIDVNRAKMSFASNAAIGFANPFTGTGGIGFIPRDVSGTGFTERENILFEGGLILEVDGQIVDAVRNAEGGLSRDFKTRQIYRTAEPGELSDSDGEARFSGIDTVASPAPEVRLQTYAYNGSGLDNVIFVRYEITNSSSFVELNNLYAGLFNDWDIANAAANSAAFSAADSLLYFSHASDGSQPIVAVAHLGTLSSALAIDNAYTGTPDSVTFGLYDGFTDNEKSFSLKAGTARTGISDTDVSGVIASGPYNLGPGATVTVGFAYAFGDDLNELRSQLQTARNIAPFDVSDTGFIESDIIPSQTRIFANYPNPFAESTNIRIDLAEAGPVNLAIYDVLGRKVAELVDGELEARIHIIPFDAGHLSSGVYFARLKTRKGIQTVSMTHIK